MTDQEFTVRKRICTAADGYQFITFERSRQTGSGLSQRVK